MVKSYRLKIVVVGEPDVGKTSIIKNFVEGAFPKDYIPTIGANFFIKNVFFEANQEEYECQLGIWDIAGQILWSAMRMQYYKGADGVFVLGDLTKPKTFEQIENFWVKDIRDCLDKVPLILLANKADLTKDSMKIDEKKMRETLGFSKIIKTSAKTGQNIQLSFQEIIKSILNLQDINPLSHLNAKAN
jgi:small GTP-binding protein